MGDKSPRQSMTKKKSELSIKEKRAAKKEKTGTGHDSVIVPAKKR